jgi:DNA-directed RNA polymerase specialized sigma24 family protein
MADGSPADVKDERTLIAQMRRGDPRAFAELIAQYVNAMTRFAFRIIGSRDTAEDVVQQVFVQLWERRATLELDMRLKAYLFRAVRNRALNESKAAAVRERYASSIPLGASQVPSHEEPVLAEQSVHAAVNRLSGRRGRFTATGRCGDTGRAGGSPFSRACLLALWHRHLTSPGDA